MARAGCGEDGGVGGASRRACAVGVGPGIGLGVRVLVGVAGGVNML